MALIKSISGIRGTIGGKAGENLSPLDTVSFTAAYAHYIKLQNPGSSPKIVIGRDGRISGPMVQNLVIQTLISMGLDVLDAGLCTTPSIEMSVIKEKAQGGIIITASHNPKEWNALKFLNERGEFISSEAGTAILDYANNNVINFSSVDQLGKYKSFKSSIGDHISAILKLKAVQIDLIRKKNYKIVVDVINSTGALAIPILLEKLGCTCILLHGEVNGEFAHNPEPLPENLTDLVHQVKDHKADLGIAVDPDVDRLAIVSENGELFGEEYTLVAVADYITRITPGNTVSNLSSTQALRDITIQNGGMYTPSAVGEVHVVKCMKETNAVIGGEGNGGIIYPKLHYGRDAMVGIALFLSHLAQSGKSCSFLRSQYPNYIISKNKIDLPKQTDPEIILKKLMIQYAKEKINTEDGLRIDLGNDWVHLRKSNTEPIIRIYAESSSQVVADHLAKKLINDIREITNGK